MKTRRRRRRLSVTLFKEGGGERKGRLKGQFAVFNGFILGFTARTFGRRKSASEECSITTARKFELMYDRG